MNWAEVQLINCGLDVSQIIGEIVERAGRNVTAEAMAAKVQADHVPLWRQGVANPIEDMGMVQPPMKHEQVRGAGRTSLERMKRQASGGDLS